MMIIIHLFKWLSFVPDYRWIDTLSGLVGLGRRLVYAAPGTAAISRKIINTLRPRQNGRHYPDDIFKCNFLNENVWISIKIWLKFVPGGPNNNFPALVQIMAWRRPGDRPLPELMMVSLLTHICITRPQWVNTFRPKQIGRHFASGTLKFFLS